MLYKIQDFTLMEPEMMIDCFVKIQHFLDKFDSQIPNFNSTMQSLNCNHHLNIKYINKINLQWHIPQRGSSSTVPQSNWHLEVLIFVEGGKPGNPEKNPHCMARTNKLNPLMMLGPGFKPGPHWREACTLITAASLLPT